MPERANTILLSAKTESYVTYDNSRKLHDLCVFLLGLTEKHVPFPASDDGAASFSQPQYKAVRNWKKATL